MMTPMDYFWHRRNKDKLKQYYINKLYKLEPDTREYKDTLFKLAIIEAEEHENS